MTQQRRFTKEFEEKRSAWCKPAGERSARSPVILGLVYRRWFRWIGRSRDRRAIDPAAAESDVTAELKRLRRENELLRQERDILKKATVFFAREGSR